ncbi:MAG: hypothetical protein ACYDAY_11525 [Candidatus Dormibacteria bacterium]
MTPMEPEKGPVTRKETCPATSKTTGNQCRNRAGFKTDHVGFGHCHLHGGRTEKIDPKILARAECARLGVPVEVDPHQALLDMVWEAAGNVAFYRQRVQQLADDELTSRTKLGAEQLQGLVTLYNDERKRLADFAKACIAAGIAERAVRLAESQADAMVALVQHVIDSPALNLTAEQKEIARGAAITHLRVLAGSA